VEAPSTAAAFVLLAELVNFRCSDLVPLDTGRWEVRFDDPGRGLDDLLHAVERCLAAWQLPATTVRIAGRPRVLSAPPSPAD
jgi:hypothetical protein